MRAGPCETIRHTDHDPPDRRRRPDRPVRPDRRLGRRQSEPIDEFRLLVRTQEDVHGRVTPTQTSAIRLTDGAAGENDTHGRVRHLELRQLAHPADDLLLGALADRAGVDDHQVRDLE